MTGVVEKFASSRGDQRTLKAAGRRAGVLGRRVVGATTARPVRSGFQVLLTTFAVLVWLGITPIYVALVATYEEYGSARSMAVGLAMCSGLAPHVWPSRTSPWRTVMLTGLLSAIIGSLFLTAGVGRFALMAATVFGFGFVALRANENGRKLWDLIQTWRALR